MVTGRREGRVLVVGSLNADLVTRVARLPRVGETVLGTSFDVIAGGKGGNQAVAAARGGAAVQVIGCVGDDSFGALLRRELRAAGIDVAAVSVEANLATGTAQILVDDEGRNQIAVAPGANLGVLPPSSVDAEVLVLQLEIPDAANDAAIDAARRSGAIIVLNAAPARPLSESTRSRLDWLIVNETEAAQLAETSVSDAAGAHRAAALLRRAGQGVVVTLGAGGAMLLADDGAIHQQAPVVDVVDTVAAGDAFVGVFAAVLARQESPREALALAVCAGSLACMRRGAQPSLPLAADIESLRATLPPSTRLPP